MSYVLLFGMMAFTGFYYAREYIKGFWRGGKPKPKKRESAGEKECRRVLEKIYGAKFPNVRPGWLRNPITNRTLELDCYNEKLSLACEYQGRQHYEYVKHFHKNKGDLRGQISRDKCKARMCKKNGVDLIVVPHSVGRDGVEKFIIRHLKRLRRL